MSPQRIHTFKNSNEPKPIKKGKGKVMKIDFGIHTDAIKKIWETPPSFRSGSMKSKLAKIQRVIGYGNNTVGFCGVCHDALNTHLIKYKVEGATVIERYCESCLSKII